MAREKKLSRHQVLLYSGDYERLKTHYPNYATVIVRALVRRHLDELRAGIEVEIDLDD